MNEIKIVRKPIRSIRLKVTPEGEVICTASKWASEEKILDFIESKKNWIEKSIQKVTNLAQNKVELNPSGQAATALLTEKDRIPRGRNYVYSKKWKELAFKNFEHTVCRFLSAFEVGLLPQFDLKARSMHSMWGNCNRKTNIITLNWELFNFPQECIDYVILHEMTHFLYIYHDKNFYGYIEKIMPDYKAVARKMK